MRPDCRLTPLPIVNHKSANLASMKFDNAGADAMSPPTAMALAVVVVALGLFASINIGSAGGAGNWLTVNTTGSPTITHVQ
jgi:hypothetical protein